MRYTAGLPDLQGIYRTRGTAASAGTGAKEYNNIDLILEKEFLSDDASEILEEKFMFEDTNEEVQI